MSLKRRPCLYCFELILFLPLFRSTAVTRALDIVSSYINILAYTLTLGWPGNSISTMHVIRKVSRKIFALRASGPQLTLTSWRIYHLSVIQPDLEYGSTAFSSSLSTSDNCLLQARSPCHCQGTTLDSHSTHPTVPAPQWSQLSSDMN